MALAQQPSSLCFSPAALTASPFPFPFLQAHSDLSHFGPRASLHLASLARGVPFSRGHENGPSDGESAEDGKRGWENGPEVVLLPGAWWADYTATL